MRAPGCAIRTYLLLRKEHSLHEGVLAEHPSRIARNVVRSLERDELGASGGTDTDLTVANWLVSHGVLTEVVADHVSLDFNAVPVLAGVDFANGADHLGHDDAVAEMSLDCLGLLTVGSVLDGLGQLLDEAIVARLDSLSESSSLAGLEHGDQLLGLQVKQLLELDTSVNLLSECFFLGSLSSLGGGKPLCDRGHI